MIRAPLPRARLILLNLGVLLLFGIYLFYLKYGLEGMIIPLSILLIE